MRFALMQFYTIDLQSTPFDYSGTLPIFQNKLTPNIIFTTQVQKNIYSKTTQKKIIKYYFIFTFQIFCLTIITLSELKIYSLYILDTFLIQTKRHKIFQLHLDAYT